MKQALFPSGVASGMTGIHPATIRRYIREYSEFFTETARKTSPGRRFTHVDLNRLLIIRHMYIKHKKAEEIKTALSGECEPLTRQQYNNLDALTILEATQKEAAQAKQYNDQARKSARQAIQTVENASHILNLFHKVIYRKKEADDLLYRVEALEAQLKDLKADLEKIQPSRHGFWGR